jgi:DNA-binding MarR family transcriptional regulator
MLNERPRMLTELASLQGVSLPTMSSSITAMEERGWVKRGAPEADRRVVMVEMTATGKAALDRVARSAEGHLADVLAPLDVPSRRRLRSGLGVLRRLFAATPPAAAARRRNRRTRRTYLT